MMAGLVLAVVLIGGLLAWAWAERRAAMGHPIRRPLLPQIEVALPLQGRDALWAQLAIIGVTVLIILIDLAILELVR